MKAHTVHAHTHTHTHMDTDEWMQMYANEGQIGWVEMLGEWGGGGGGIISSLGGCCGGGGGGYSTWNLAS